MVYTVHCCWNRLPQTRGIYYPIVLEVQRPKSNINITRCQWGLASSGGSTEEAILCLFQLWWASGISWLVATSFQYLRRASSNPVGQLHITFSSACVQISFCSLLQGYIWLHTGPTWIPRIISQSQGPLFYHSCKVFFLYKEHKWEWAKFILHKVVLFSRLSKPLNHWQNQLLDLFWGLVRILKFTLYLTKLESNSSEIFSTTLQPWAPPLLDYIVQV